MRRMRLTLLALALALVACSPPAPTPDAGPDTSCGFDCAAQNKYGLIKNRCFEYSSDPLTKQDPPALGVWVKDNGANLFNLEGGVPVLQVEYRMTGQIRMIDDVAVIGGALMLMRREFVATGQSITYKDSANKIVGVKWLALDTAAGQTLTTQASGFLVNQSGVGTTDDTTFKVTTFDASASELQALTQTYPAGLKLVFSETPAHGNDTRRVFIPDVGFAVIASNYALTGGAPLPMTLQKVRDIGSADGGTADCSLGAP